MPILTCIFIRIARNASKPTSNSFLPYKEFLHGIEIRIMPYTCNIQVSYSHNSGHFPDFCSSLDIAQIITREGVLLVVIFPPRGECCCSLPHHLNYRTDWLFQANPTTSRAKHLIFVKNELFISLNGPQRGSFSPLSSFSGYSESWYVDNISSPSFHAC